MLRGAGWITPHLNGVPYFDKPPLPYWLMAGAFAWLGPTETAARLVSALATVAVAVLTALIGTRLASGRVGLMAGLMVAANLEVFLFGRMVKPDMLFVACILLGLYGFILAYLGGGRWPLLLFYGGLGLAVLAKDFLGAVGPLAIVALFLWLTREGGSWRQWAPISAILLLLAVAVPWYLLVESQYRGFLWYTVVDNHVLNVARQRVFPDEDVPLSTLEFLGVTALGFFPWVLALPLAVARVVRRAAVEDSGGAGLDAARPLGGRHPRRLRPVALQAAALRPARVSRDGPPGGQALGRGHRAAGGRPALVQPARSRAARDGRRWVARRSRAWLGWLRLSPEAVAVADVSARNMAAQGQAATSDFLAQFRPLFGPIAGIFLLTTAALAVAAWRRLPRLGLGALLAAMIAFLPLSVEGLTLFAKSRSVRLMTDAILLRAGPVDVLAHEGPIENSASALLRLDRRVQIVNGLAVQPGLRLDLCRGAAALLGHRRAGARLGGGPARLPALRRHARPERGARAAARARSSPGRGGEPAALFQPAVSAAGAILALEKGEWTPRASSVRRTGPPRSSPAVSSPAW